MVKGLIARPQSVVAIANTHVPFPTAARWAGIRFGGETRSRGVKVHCPFGATEHPDGGRDPAMRVYWDHGWCFAEQRYFSPVSLLAEVWQVSREDAAARALEQVGYVPADYTRLWDEALRTQQPDLEALAQALLTWCSVWNPAWPDLQYTPKAGAMLSRCLELLASVHDEKDADIWLTGCKKVMGRVLRES